MSTIFRIKFGQDISHIELLTIIKGIIKVYGFNLKISRSACRHGSLLRKWLFENWNPIGFILLNYVTLKDKEGNIINSPYIPKSNKKSKLPKATVQNQSDDVQKETNNVSKTSEEKQMEWQKDDQPQIASEVLPDQFASIDVSNLSESDQFDSDYFIN